MGTCYGKTQPKPPKTACRGPRRLCFLVASVPPLAWGAREPSFLLYQLGLQSRVKFVFQSVFIFSRLSVSRLH